MHILPRHTPSKIKRPNAAMVSFQALAFLFAAAGSAPILVRAERISPAVMEPEPSVSSEAKSLRSFETSMSSDERACEALDERPCFAPASTHPVSERARRWAISGREWIANGGDREGG